MFFPHVTRSPEWPVDSPGYCPTILSRWLLSSWSQGGYITSSITAVLQAGLHEVDGIILILQRGKWGSRGRETSASKECWRVRDNVCNLGHRKCSCCFPSRMGLSQVPWGWRCLVTWGTRVSLWLPELPPMVSLRPQPPGG